MPSTPANPAIEQLARRLSSGEAGSEDTFWRDVAASGTPLIAPADDDPTHSIVTFVWRGDADTVQVALFCDITGEAVAILDRLPGSRVWHGSYRVRNDVRSGYVFAVNQALPTDLEDLAAAYRRRTERGELTAADPLNRHQVDLGVPGTAISTVELPGAPAQPWAISKPSAAAGRIEPHRFESGRLGNSRIVWTYLPPNYDPGGQAYPLLVLYDGYTYLKTDIAATLDNLIRERRIPPLVVALVHQLDRIHELMGNADFAASMAEELVGTWLPERYNVTADPLRTGIGGQSAGGLGALFAAYQHPDVFGNVLSQSGAFWWGPGVTLPADIRLSGVEWHWLTSRIEVSSRLRLRVYLEVGEMEVPRRPGQPDMLASNRRMCAALAAKDYPVRYSEYAGGHDLACWRGSVADGLIWLFGETFTQQLAG